MDIWNNEDRWLADAYGAYGKEEEPLDYTVLSVAVLTLGLVLLVEVVRHRLDHEAKHRPFFKVVLETTYSELATLGLVELFVFLLLRYYKLKYKERKEIFAEVHFALFYAAIFNAFQSIMCAVATRRVSDKMWVKTEHLELDHYIEIREEFERVQEAYFAVRNSVPKVFRRIWAAIRHPGLRSRYMDLLLQVRFHQLRIHFLENNNLPLTFKVSEYLKRSEETVLMHMVHVNGTAWLLLTGGFSLMYFITGMVANKTGSPEVVGNCLFAMFFSMLFIFIFICVMLYIKMTRVFERILKVKHCEMDNDVGTRRQLQLFWYSEPHLVIALIQFMQFGYAIALAIVLMFWENLGPLEPYYYLVIITCCYVVFVFVLAKVLPQYTLCTSMGHLVNKEHLNETLALHRLKEAQKRQKQRQIQLTFGEDLDESIICTKINEEMCKPAGATSLDGKGKLSRGQGVELSTAPTGFAGSLSDAKQEQSLPLPKMASLEKRYESGLSHPSIAAPSSTGGYHLPRQSSNFNSALLAELVKMDTSKLRQQLPEKSQALLTERDNFMRDGRIKRRKSLSDGVLAMQMPTLRFTQSDTISSSLTSTSRSIEMTSKQDNALNDVDRGNPSGNRRANSRKSVSASNIIQTWRKMDEASSDQQDQGGLASKEPQASNQPIRSVDLWEAQLAAADGMDPPVIRKSVGFSEELEMSRDDDSFERNPGNDADYLTIDTEKSEDDLSDIGVIRKSDFESLRSQYIWEDPWHVRLLERLRPTSLKKSLHGMFLSERYPLISHVFGTIVVFFLIGMRVEAFNAVLGIYSASQNTWDLRLHASFWWETGWYATFIFVSALAIVSVYSPERKSPAEMAVLGAAIIDIFLTTACLTLLFVAESRRCCDDEVNYEDGYRRLFDRFLAGETDSYASKADTEYDKTDTYGSSTKDAEYDEYQQCCPRWGYRTFGGLGKIEPFTALIALRVLRFQIAKLILKKRTANAVTKQGGSDTRAQQGLSKDHNNHTQNHSNHGGDTHGHGDDDQGTIQELWQRAVNQHPHIVEKYGHFSGELFQAMLGLEIVQERSISFTLKAVAPSHSVKDIHGLSLDQPRENVEGPATPLYKLNGEQYTRLSAECQGIILAGKLGKPVKSMSNLFDQFSNDRELPTLHEDSVGVPTRLSAPKSVEFEVDDDRLAEEQNDDSMFIAPNARLVRCMRRCDRRLYPLLKQWIAVDVVMTEHEIVYFEIEKDTQERRKREALRLALQATKGGKGLRLIDIAEGRKVVGKLDLTDVTQVYVERDMPLPDISHLVANEVNIDVANQVPSEYWQKRSHVELYSESRALRWARVKEDRLKLISRHGTLMLRFYSDLNDVESHAQESLAEDEVCGHLKKNIAFQWAQTVAHICGTDQLKQPLPHFGHDDSEEFRDLLEIVHHRIGESKGFRRGRGGQFVATSARSRHSVILPDESGTPLSANDRPLSPRAKKRASKFGDNSAERSTRLNIFRRFSAREPESNLAVQAGGAEGMQV